MTEQEQAVIQAAIAWKCADDAYHYAMTKRACRSTRSLTTDELPVVEAAYAAEDRLRDAINTLLAHPDAGRPDEKGDK